MIYGIDIGSRQVKIVFFNEKKNEFIKKIKFDTFEFYNKYGKKINHKLQIDLKSLGILNGEIIATGYGRYNINFDDAKVIPEIQAHYWGALYQTKLNDFLLVDLGGQDSKVINVINGKIDDFIMNDKCAASTGRFIENMSRILQIPLEQMSKFYKKPLKINSTCAVFCETEVINLLINGYDIAEIAAGVNYSLFKRLLPMIKKYNFNHLVFSGGTSKNSAILHYFKETFNKEIYLLDDPEFNGAIGTVIFYLNRKSQS